LTVIVHNFIYAPDYREHSFISLLTVLECVALEDSTSSAVSRRLDMLLSHLRGWGIESMSS